MKSVKRLSTWWKGEPGPVRTEPLIVKHAQDPADEAVATARKPVQAAMVQEDDAVLQQLRQEYRVARWSEVQTPSSGTAAPAMEALRNYYVTTGRDLADLSSLAAEVDTDLFVQFTGG